MLACRRRGRARQLKAQAAVQAPDSLHPSTFLGGWKILQRYQRVTKTALKLTLFEVDQVGEKIQKSFRKSTKMDVPLTGFCEPHRHRQDFGVDPVDPWLWRRGGLDTEMHRNKLNKQPENWKMNSEQT